MHQGWDPLWSSQFTYRSNRSTDISFSVVLHIALTHLDNPNAWIRIMFADSLLFFSFNISLWTTSPCPTTTTTTGVPQGCVFIKYTDDTTIVSLISSSSEAPYREEVQILPAHAESITSTHTKNKEIHINFRKVQTTQHSVLSINREEVKQVGSSKFLCLPIRGPELERELRPHHHESPAAPLHPEISEAQQPSPPLPQLCRKTFTSAPWRASWHMAVLSGAPAARKQRGRNYSRSSKQLRVL